MASEAPACPTGAPRETLLDTDDATLARWVIWACPDLGALAGRHKRIEEGCGQLDGEPIGLQGDEIGRALHPWDEDADGDLSQPAQIRCHTRVLSASV